MNWLHFISFVESQGVQVLDDGTYVHFNRAGESASFLQVSDGYNDAIAWLNQDQRATCKVHCEACGALYEPEYGYYEGSEYSYCSNCCNW